MIAAIAFLAWAAGFVLFARAHSELTVRFPRTATPPSAEHNLAALRFGPTVRASSYDNDFFTQQHPAYLVDAAAHPIPVEKWASAPRDREPWVELTWREPRALDRVVIHHAGSAERGAVAVRRYELRCLQASGAGAAVQVQGNAAVIATHPLRCPGATGIRLRFWPNSPGQVVGVYEVEAWGR